MFKKRRQRSKKYTLTSFGSVDEDMCQDFQEEDGVFPGSESEFDDDGFSAAPDPTWDSDYLDMLEKRAAASTGGRGETSGDAPSPGLSDTTGKGAQLFEQQRRRAAEHAKKSEVAQPQNLDERPARYRYGQPSDVYNEVAEEVNGNDVSKGRMPPPVAPKPRVIHEALQIPQAEGKGAQLFARRQSRMGMYVVDTPPETPYQQEYAKQFQSAPELNILSSLPPLKPNPAQVPKPRFVATKGGVHVWRPGAL
ncbi:hypothetical protein CRUP_012584 [Coryphaenoides rupestris]|nr:hypothetical protein CRUP_012584 [Coryphaenoides rupestris]